MIRNENRATDHQTRGPHGTELDLRPLSPAIGVEIRGVDLASGLDGATFAAIQHAWEENCVALFRGQRLEQDAQVAFAQRFGPLAEIHNATRSKELHPAILLISNIRENGELIGELPDGEMYFHSDQCYVERPAMATMLYAIEIPSFGGNTCFANAFRAYETLPADLKTRLEGRLAVQAYDYDGSRGGSPRLRGERLTPDVRQFAHPIFRTHPRTGRKALYVNRMQTQHIVGMDLDESDALLEMLFDHLEQPEFVYEHVWTPGDLILWDNRSCAHARTDFAPTERRLLRRVTVLGEKPY
jgi:taurine dioxygenase